MSPESQESNTVVVNAEEPEFTVEKLQKIKGTDAEFTTDFLTGTAGQTVEYEIVVKNTGEVPLHLSPVVDTKCTNVSPAGATEVAVGNSETFTCEHALAKPGEFWSNDVTVQSGGVSEDSNTVYACKRSKNRNSRSKSLQKVEGSEAPLHERRTDGQTGSDDRLRDRGLEHGQQDPRVLDAVGHQLHRSVSRRTPPNSNRMEREIFTCQHVLGGRRRTGRTSPKSKPNSQRTEQPEAVHTHAVGRAREA